MINESGASPFAAPNIPRPTNQPSGRRKQWGVESVKKQELIGTNFLDSNTPETLARKDRVKLLSLSDSDEEQKKRDAAVTANDHEDEDDYSDSFEEVNATVETVKNQDIEDLLKTATEDQLNILKQSLGNWADVKRLAEGNQSTAQKPSAQKSSAIQVLDFQKNRVDQT